MEISVTRVPAFPEFLRIHSLVVVDASPWFADPEFLAWVRQPGVATWHDKDNPDPTDCSDVWTAISLNYGGPRPGELSDDAKVDYIVAEGSDHPDADGMPERYWSQLVRMLYLRFGAPFDCVVWLQPIHVYDYINERNCPLCGETLDRMDPDEDDPGGAPFLFCPGCEADFTTDRKVIRYGQVRPITRSIDYHAGHAVLRQLNDLSDKLPRSGGHLTQTEADELAVRLKDAINDLYTLLEDG